MSNVFQSLLRAEARRFERQASVDDPETGALAAGASEIRWEGAIFERVTMFRDDALARDVPGGLYIGHVKVEGGPATIHHHEHAPIALGEGTYRVRRQRELEPKDAVIVAD